MAHFYGGIPERGDTEATIRGTTNQCRDGMAMISALVAEARAATRDIMSVLDEIEEIASCRN